jgi:hypothetical protein
MGFLREDGTTEPTGFARWFAWLPTRAQVGTALLLEFDAEIGGAQLSAEEHPASASMRQVAGLVVVCALLAGLLPFVVNWYHAGRVGTALPFARLAEVAGEQVQSLAGSGPLSAVWESARVVAGLPPAILPGPLAAFLSALGEWINWPLRWLALWIVYGAGVMLAAKLLGATTTLQHFYAATGYAAVPLMLTGLGPIPCVGALASLAGIVWAAVVYVAAVRAVGPLSTSRAILASLAPMAALLALAGIGVLAVLVTLIRLAM